MVSSIHTIGPPVVLTRPRLPWRCWEVAKKAELSSFFQDLVIRALFTIYSLFLRAGGFYILYLATCGVLSLSDMRWLVLSFVIISKARVAWFWTGRIWPLSRFGVGVSAVCRQSWFARLSNGDSLYSWSKRYSFNIKTAGQLTRQSLRFYPLLNEHAMRERNRNETPLVLSTQRDRIKWNGWCGCRRRCEQEWITLQQINNHDSWCKYSCSGWLDWLFLAYYKSGKRGGIAFPREN